MPTAIVDGEEDDRRAALPDSVDRILGEAMGASEHLTVGVLDAARAALAEMPRDANTDRLSGPFALDVLIDGTVAARAVIDGLQRRLKTPVLIGEKLSLASTAR